MTEKRLIEQARRRNRKAQTELYERYRTYWYMLSLRYNRNEHDAQDVLQEAMIQIFSKLDQFKGDRGTFKSWSGRIVINHCITFLRKNRPTQFADQLEDHGYLKEDDHTPIDLLSAEELMGVIRKLPDGYRTIFNLYVLEGYNHREISGMLNISEGTSKSQLFKAKKLLKEKLEVLYTT